MSKQQETLSWRRICRLFENDRLAARHPGWKRVLERCAVFDFSAHDFEEMGCAVTENADELVSPLPFPQIAVVHTWQFFACDSFWLSDDNEMVGTNLLAVVTPYEEHRQEYELVMSGYVEMQIPYGYQAGDPDKAECSDLRHTTLLKGNPSWVDRETEEMHALGPGEADPHGNAEVMLPGMIWNLVRFLLFINDEAHFIIRRSPTKTSRAKRDKIPRLHQRPTYIVLDKQAITTRYLESSPSNRRSPMPHLRRGHYRTLVAERFKEPGKRVWVRATHVKGNEVEWREGDRHYKVV